MRNHRAPLSIAHRDHYEDYKNYPAPTTTLKLVDGGDYELKQAEVFSSRLYGHHALQGKNQTSVPPVSNPYQEISQPADNFGGVCDSFVRTTASSHGELVLWDQTQAELRRLLGNKKESPQSIAYERPCSHNYNNHNRTTSPCRESAESRVNVQNDYTQSNSDETKNVSYTRITISSLKESPKQKTVSDRKVVQHNYKDHAFQPHAFAELHFSVQSTSPLDPYDGMNTHGTFVKRRSNDNQSQTAALFPRLQNEDNCRFLLSAKARTDDAPKFQSQGISLPLFESSARIMFPERVYRMLHESSQDETLVSIVSWQPHGRCFVVRKPKEFVSNVLPRYFRGQHKMTSFQRQLNLYGFKRISQGLDQGGYYHELFLRGRPFLCRLIARTQVKGNRVKPIPNPQKEPDFYSMRPCLEEDRFHPIENSRSLAPPPPVACMSSSTLSVSTRPKKPSDELMGQNPTIINHPITLANIPGILHTRNEQQLGDFHDGIPTVMWNETTDSCIVQWPGGSQRFLQQYPYDDQESLCQNHSRQQLRLTLPDYGGMAAPLREFEHSNAKLQDEEMHHHQLPIEMQRPMAFSSSPSYCHLNSDVEHMAHLNNKRMPDFSLERGLGGAVAQQSSPQSVAAFNQDAAGLLVEDFLFKMHQECSMLKKPSAENYADTDPLLDGDIASVDSSLLEIEEEEHHDENVTFRLEMHVNMSETSPIFLIDCEPNSQNCVEFVLFSTRH